jgi:hypothetical protein
MHEDDLKRLNVGDIVQRAMGGPCYVVAGNSAGHITTEPAVDIINPIDWETVAPAPYFIHDRRKPLPLPPTPPSDDPAQSEIDRLWDLIRRSAQSS